jgi:hypothetical protein
MKTIILIGISLFFLTGFFAQNRIQVEKTLRNIEHFSQIDSLKRANPRWEIRGETLSASDTVNFPFLKNSEIGSIVKTTVENRYKRNYLVKILDFEIQHLCRVEYIFLDGDKLQTHEIDSIRTEIHRRVKRGEKFHDMIPEYTMDGGTGDIGWFSKEMVVNEFYEPILTKSKGDVFDISIPEYNWYYVVNKTHEDLVRKYFYTIWVGYD